MAKRSTVIFILALVFFCLAMMLIVGLLSVIFAGDSGPTGRGNVAVIPVKGVILSEGSSSLFGTTLASSTDIVEWIEDADRNPSVKAIILEINSPGGSPVASEEIANALERTNKTTVAWIRDIGTSGAYWVASACDQVVANRMSLTGSIGVISSYIEFSGLMDDYNVTYQRLVSGKYKDIGSPYKKMTEEEEELWQEQIDILHEFFIEEVARNRGLTIEHTRELATGLFYTGFDAQKKGLVDILGGKKEAIDYIERKHHMKVKLSEYRRKATFLDILSSSFYEGSFNIGRGFGYEIKRTENDLLVLT